MTPVDHHEMQAGCIANALATDALGELGAAAVMPQGPMAFEPAIVDLDSESEGHCGPASG